MGWGQASWLFLSQPQLSRLCHHSLPWGGSAALCKSTDTRHGPSSALLAPSHSEAGARCWWLALLFPMPWYDPRVDPSYTFMNKDVYMSLQEQSPGDSIFPRLSIDTILEPLVYYRLFGETILFSPTVHLHFFGRNWRFLLTSSCTC